MVGGLNTIVTALIVVFAVTFVGLVAQIFYVLWRRWRCDRQPQQPSSPAGGGEGDSVVVVRAKECVYLFCWRNRSRIEPKEIASRVDDDSETADEVEKWQELCGPSRALFTIKEEEEREGMESSLESDCSSLMVDEPKLKRASPCTDDDPTPFATPSASPPYYTPSPSPTRENDVGSSNFPADKDSDDNQTTPSFTIEIRSQ